MYKKCSNQVEAIESTSGELMSFADVILDGAANDDERKKKATLKIVKEKKAHEEEKINFPKRGNHHSLTHSLTSLVEYCINSSI